MRERERERSLWREFSENIFHKLNEYNNHKLFIQHNYTKIILEAKIDLTEYNPLHIMLRESRNDSWKVVIAQLFTAEPNLKRKQSIARL